MQWAVHCTAWRRVQSEPPQSSLPLGPVHSTGVWSRFSGLSTPESSRASAWLKGLRPAAAAARLSGFSGGQNRSHCKERAGHASAVWCAPASVGFQAQIRWAQRRYRWGLWESYHVWHRHLPRATGPHPLKEEWNGGPTHIGVCVRVHACVCTRVCVCARRVCVCVCTSVSPFFTRSPGWACMATLASSGWFRSPLVRPTVQATGASLCCPSTSECHMHLRQEPGSLPYDHPRSGVVAPWVPPGQLHGISSPSPCVYVCV